MPRSGRGTPAVGIGKTAATLPTFAASGFVLPAERRRLVLSLALYGDLRVKVYCI